MDASLAQRHRQRLEYEDVENALRFALLARRLYNAAGAPAETVLRLADTHRRLADALLVDAPRGLDGALEALEIDPATLEQARQHYASAGRGFVDHARQTLLGDPERSAESLWQAADAFDHAGDLDRAVALFAEYTEVRHDDPRRLEGLYRLARARQARGEYEEASGLYAQILEENPNSPPAHASYVPLARSLLFASADADTERAEELLQTVVSGEVFEPNAPEFREALVELGRLFRRSGRYTDAISRLDEALRRFPDLDSDPEFVFNLADAYRLASDAIRSELESRAMPRPEREELRSIREGRLVRALELYESARDMLHAENPSRLTELDRIMLRNATFYRADCAFDLGSHFEGDQERSRAFYERAIREYDTAAQRYASDPASLVAMVQIVNCYAALGKWREVQTAHERARARLAELPPESWEQGATPMDRQSWERWLDASLELDRLAAADAGG